MREHAIRPQDEELSAAYDRVSDLLDNATDPRVRNVYRLAQQELMRCILELPA